MSVKGAEILNEAIKKYYRYKDSLDPSGTILKKHIDRYRRRLANIFGYVPSELGSVGDLLKNNLGSKKTEENYGLNELSAHFSSDKMRRLISSFGINQSKKSEILSGRDHALVFNYFNENINDGEVVAQLESNGLNISGVMYKKASLLSLGLRTIITMNITEINGDRQGVQRGMILAYSSATEEMLENKRLSDEKVEQERLRKEEIEAALIEDGTYEGINQDLGWATLTDFTVSGGEVVQVKIIVKGEERARTYTSKTSGRALERTIMDMAKSGLLDSEEFREGTNTKRIIDSVLSTSASKYLLDLIKMANHLDYLKLNKEADYLDSIIKMSSDRLIDQFTPSLTEDEKEDEESEDEPKDQVNFG